MAEAAYHTLICVHREGWGEEREDSAHSPCSGGLALLGTEIALPTKAPSSDLS